jgi:hypothetical protein
VGPERVRERVRAAPVHMSRHGAGRAVRTRPPGPARQVGRVGQSGVAFSYAFSEVFSVEFPEEFCRGLLDSCLKSTFGFRTGLRPCLTPLVPLGGVARPVSCAQSRGRPARQAGRHNGSSGLRSATLFGRPSIEGSGPRLQVLCMRQARSGGRRLPGALPGRPCVACHSGTAC